MRRKITLYIADRLVDLDEQSFILLNYTMEDLTNPTIVKNSFSQQITIKGTANNNAIFGDAFRLDRKVGNNGGIAGADFNPLRKTPFAIYNEMNEVLESGYCRLDSAIRKKGSIEYKITLFGGLGSFLYSLSYDDNGEKKSLASLDYLGTDDSDTELDFAINATNVAAAWKRVEDSQDVIDDIWDVINFAPAYNGIPDGDFSADKAVVVPSKIGLQDTISGHTLKSGYALVNLSENCDEWSVKDLRSYLQRPVFSMRAFLEAIKGSTTYMDEVDMVVPRNCVNDMVVYLHNLQKEMDIRIKSFGHAGDGNLHAYILKDDLSDEEWEKRMKDTMEKIYQKAHELRGQVSGEHGIGFAKKPYLRESLPTENLELMNGIKRVFDPKNILNPHKVAQL